MLTQRLLAAALVPAVAAAAGVAGAETVQQGKLRLGIAGHLRPQALPREGMAPVGVYVSGGISTTDGSLPPQLRRLTIEVNRHGRLDASGLPTCRREEVQAASNARALGNCRRALVGQGSFRANIVLPGQPPYPARGRLLVFNGRSHGRPALFAHIYTNQPFATAYTLVFRIRHLARGVYGTELATRIPRTTASWLYVTGIQMTLSRRYFAAGRHRSYVSAGCPAPASFSAAVFPLIHADFVFAGGRSLGTSVLGRCRVRG